MRLLNTKTLNLEDSLFLESTPPYAILSHTWGCQEVTLQELASPNENTTRKSGYAKIEQTCKKALDDNLQYAWVDTCCIDKTSSAELSEAINSMFCWYEKAAVCYAYLADVQPGAEIDTEDSEFAKSRWFTRGWTLQELIAPSKLLFFANDWSLLFERSTKSEMISEITRIEEYILYSRDHVDISRMLARASTAKKLSWASKRCTTRTEDMAYCLLGLFSINIPLIYGEGPKAFLRLQKEIVQHSNDQSLFAWENKLPQAFSHSFGIFASSPADFANSGNVVPANLEEENSPPFSVTNNGLHITMPVFTQTEGMYPFEPRKHYGLLQCKNTGNPLSMVVIPLTRSHGSAYKRLNSASLDFVDQRAWFQWPKSPIYIAIDSSEENKNKFRDFFFIRKTEGLSIESLDSSKLGMTIPLGDVWRWRCGEKKCVRSVLISSGDNRAWLTLSARIVYEYPRWPQPRPPVIWTYYSFSHQNRSNPSQIPAANNQAPQRLLRVEGGAFYAELSNQDAFGNRVFVVDVLFISSIEAIHNLWVRTQVRGALDFALASLERLCPHALSWKIWTITLYIYFNLFRLPRLDILFLISCLILMGFPVAFLVRVMSMYLPIPAFCEWIGTVLANSKFVQMMLQIKRMGTYHFFFTGLAMAGIVFLEMNSIFPVSQRARFQPHGLPSSRSDAYVFVRFRKLLSIILILCSANSFLIVIGTFLYFQNDEWAHIFFTFFTFYEGFLAFN